MAFSDYYSTPTLNVTIAGINIAEGCPAANINNALRQLMADARAFSDSIPNLSGLAMLSGAVFTGPISQSGHGGYFYHNDAANASGKWFVQPIGGAVPAGMANGDFLAEY